MGYRVGFKRGWNGAYRGSNPHRGGGGSGGRSGGYSGGRGGGFGGRGYGGRGGYANRY